jgi:conjugal transfer mating pair stabilization protein TraN
VLSLALTTAAAQSQTDVLIARDQALSALKGFNPATVLNGFTESPHESTLHPGEGADSLKAQGFNALKSNPVANDIFQQEATRLKVRPSPNSPEMQYGETLLENPESVLDGACYTEKGDCNSQVVTKTCEDRLNYLPKTCKETLDVKVITTTHHFKRVLIPNLYTLAATFDLTRCPFGDRYCVKGNTIDLEPSCEALWVLVTWLNQTMLVSKQPTCANPTVTVELVGESGFLWPFEVTVIQYSSVDSWSNNDCDAIPKNSNGQCLLDNAPLCLEPNVVKDLSGIPIKRPCWGKEFNYQCSHLDTSACESLLNQGCTQSASTCVEVKDNRCERYSQTFQCMEQFCMPEKTICPGKIGCADGNCDLSKGEESDDMGEGIARLGALAGVAGEVALHQIHSGSASIFAGSNKTCRTLIKPLGNCCEGKARLLNCTDEEKELARAKKDKRAFKVGKYCAFKALICEEEKESWCVFPTQLSSIVQIQGRFNQLKIPFGYVEDKTNDADCRGLTPEELERIDFSLLNLKPLETDLLSRQAFPNNDQINGSNQSHIERLKESGRAYD